jgi:hypothetical protein
LNIFFLVTRVYINFIQKVNCNIESNELSTKRAFRNAVRIVLSKCKKPEYRKQCDKFIEKLIFNEEDE